MLSTNVEKKINQALAIQDYGQALDLYADWCKSPETRCELWAIAHRRNAASLARKKLYDSLIGEVGNSQRSNAALEHFVGLREASFTHPLQQPSFFYYPGLRAQPFYALSDVPELDALLSIIKQSLLQLRAPIEKHSVSYVDHIGSVPNEEQWQKLRYSWQAQHLITGGQHQPSMQSFSTEFGQCFTHRLIPDCPPFAPEVFISVLEPNAYIPPHYGISNVKLTAHIPLHVTNNAWLKAGDEVFTWHENAEIMIFDDSFLHSAKNADENGRSVLIFDLWHPDLTEQERVFVQSFMREYSKWEKRYGRLAGLDRE